ncbi:MAG: caspase family protein, partial [Planctomycetota bacterium]
MSRLLFKLVLSTLFFISLTPFISAEGGKQNVYTVIVGVSKYKDAQIKEKPKAEADAVALFKLLSDKNILGLTKENGKLLLGEPKNAKDLSDFTSEATRENVLEALKWAASKATPDDLVIFGFFGQGGPM